MSEVSIPNLMRYTNLWTMISTYGTFLAAMYRTVVSEEEKLHGKLLEAEATLYLIYKATGKIYRFETEDTRVEFIQLMFNTLIKENKEVFEGVKIHEGLHKRMDDYRNSEKEFEFLLNNLNSTRHTLKFQNSYPVIIGDVYKMMSQKVDFYSFYISLLNNNFSPAFDKLYQDGVSFMEQSSDQIGNRLSSVAEKSTEDRSSVNSNSEHESNVNKKEGCYIATAVYGDYNHGKVLILRKYRDNHLAKSYLGRMFIFTYYLISPVLSKYFKKGIISNISIKILDKITKHLILKDEHF